MKIIMNVPLLEKLIGGDTEIEVEIRKAVVHEFAKRHLSAVADAMSVELAATKAEVFAKVLQEMGVSKITKWNESHIEITNEVKEEIKRIVKEALHVELRATARAMWTEMELITKDALKTFYDREMLILIRAQVREDLLNGLKK